MRLKKALFFHMITHTNNVLLIAQFFLRKREYFPPFLSKVAASISFSINSHALISMVTNSWCLITTCYFYLFFFVSTCDNLYWSHLWSKTEEEKEEEQQKKEEEYGYRKCLRDAEACGDIDSSKIYNRKSTYINKWITKYIVLHLHNSRAFGDVNSIQ